MILAMSEEDLVLLSDIIYVIDVFGMILGILLGIVLFFCFKYYFTKKHKPKKSDSDVEYVRDIPEGWTAGEMCPLYYYFDKKNVYIDESFSATILDLTRRKYLEVYDEDPDDDIKAKIKIVNHDKNALKVHEGIVLSLLENASQNKEWFSMEEFEGYLKSHEEYVAGQMDAYKKACEKKSEELGCYLKHDPKKNKIASASAILVAAGIFLLVYEVYVFNYLYYGVLALGGLMLFGSSTSVRLTPIGNEMYLKFHALGKYMEDFSNLKEHEIQTLTIWEEYMVFATAMGIAEKVSKNMEVAYPELNKEDNGTVGVKRSLTKAFNDNPIFMTTMFLRGSKVLGRGAARIFTRAFFAANGGGRSLLTSFTSSSVRGGRGLADLGRVIGRIGGRIGRR